MSTENDVEVFLRGARDQGFVTDAAAAECRKIALVLMEVDSGMPIDEIAVRKGFLTRKQADTVLRATARRRVGPYEVIEKIGAGAVGRVFRARDTRDGTVVALKLLADSVRKSEGGERALERFLREARVAGTLNHPNIVRGLGSGEVAGYTYFAMEFVPGESLEAVVARGKMPEKEAFRIAREVVKALEHLAKFQLIHRDIKPANVMVTPDGQVKLCDLGLTKPALREAKELGVQEVPLGTAVYVSPEQISRPDNIDWRADVYSLGATLYHMVAGAPPFTADTPQAIAKKHQETPPRDPREFAVELGEGATNVILKMLQKDPMRRHASLEDLDEDMLSVIEGRVPVHTLSSAPVSARPAAPTVRAGRHDERRKSGGGGGIAVAAVLIAGGAAAWWFLRDDTVHPTTPAPPPRTGTANGTGGSDSATGPTGTEPTEPGDESGTDDTPADDGTTAEESGKTAFSSAMAYWRAHPTDYAEAETRLRFVADRYPGTAVEKQARTALAEVAARLGAVAQTELEKRAERADPAEAAGRLAEAWGAYQGYPQEYADTPAGKARVATQARIAEAARKIVDAAIVAAGKAADAGDYAEAKRILAAAAPAALPDVESTLRNARDDIETRETFSAAGRAQQRDAFDDVWLRAVVAAANGDVTAALTLIEKARPKIDAWGKETDDLAAALAEIVRVPATARTAWGAMAGEAVHLAVPARPGGTLDGKAAGLAGDKLVVDAGAAGKVQVELREIAGADVVRIAAKGMDARSAADQRALLLYALGRRQIAAARAQVDALRVAGGAADTAAHEVDRVERRVDAELSEIFRRLDAARRQKRAAEARAAATEADLLVPGDARVQVAFAVLALDAGQADEARRILDRVAARKDAPPEVHLRIGQVLALKGDVEKARTEIKAYLDSAPPSDPLRREAEDTLADVNERAARTVAEQVRKDANRLFAAKKWGDAKASYRRIVELIPTDAEAVLRLGLCHARQNEVFPAYRYLTQFVKANPSHPKVGEAQKELQGLEKWKVVRAEDREVARDAAKSLESGKFDDAINGYGRALVYSPFLDTARLGLGRALLARGKANGSREDLTGALDAFGEYLFLHDDAADGIGGRAETYLALGDLRHAAADADRATQLDATSTVAPLVAAEAHFRLGHLAEARAAYAEAHKRKPSAQALYGLAMVDERDGEFDRALDELDQLLSGYELSDALRKDVNDAIRRIRPRASRR